MPRWLIVLLVPAIIMLASVGRAAEKPPAPRIPDPSECHVSGRTPDQLAALRVFVATRGVSDQSQPARTALPEGSPTEPATRAEITGLVDELFGCLAAGAGDRAFLLASDANLVKHIDDPEEAVAFVAGLAHAQATPMPHGQQGRYSGPWDVRMLPDGRVSAAVWLDSEDEHPARGVTAIYIFVFEDGEWRLDDSFTYIFASSATPTTENKVRRRSAEPELVYVADLVGWPEIESRSATPVS